MERTVGSEFLMIVVDKGLLALVVGGLLLVAQHLFSSSIEKYRSNLTYQRAVAELQVEKLQTLWHLVNAYGESVKRMLTSQNVQAGLLEDLEKANEDLYYNLSLYGIHLGLAEVNWTKDALSLDLIVEALTNKDEQGYLAALQKFQEVWLQTLAKLEERLKRLNM